MYLPRARQFWAVGLGHLTNDIFMAMGVVVLTFLSASIMPISNTAIGFAVSAQQIAGAVSQPFFGAMADRTGGRWLGTIGLAWTVGMFMTAVLMAVLTRNYFIVLIPFVLQGVGSGAVHPVGMLNAAEAERARSATSMSYFFLMGQFGLALGPALAGLMLDAANPARALPGVPGGVLPLGMGVNLLPVFLLGIIVLPGVVMMATSIPMRREGPAPRKNRADGGGVRLPVMPFVVLGVMVILRGLAQPGSVNFIPALFQAKGWSPAEYGLITSFFWVAGGISGVIFGNLADRYDRRWIIMVSMLLSAPAFFFLPIVDGALAFLAAIAAGGFSGGGHSIIVVLAQDLIPASKGLAGGAILGFIFATGALGSLLIGGIADSIGLETTFQIVGIVAVLSGVLALLLPRRD